MGKTGDTFDPMNKGSSMSLSDSNKTVTKTGTSHHSVFGTKIIKGKGKYHWKLKIVQYTSGAWNPLIGIIKVTHTYPTNAYFTNQANNGYAYVAFSNKGNKTIPDKPGTGLTDYGKMMKTGDTID